MTHFFEKNVLKNVLKTFVDLFSKLIVKTDFVLEGETNRMQKTARKCKKLH